MQNWLNKGNAMEDIQTAIAALHAAQPDRDFLVISHAIDRSLHLKLSALLKEKRRNEKVTVFLTTYGGDPNGGFRAARCLRHYYKHVRLAVPSFCKSAGTLIALSADELRIGDLGELGPLDIQVRKGSELQESSSGLDIMQALQAVTSHTQDAFHRLLVGTRNLGLSTKLCAEFASTVASGIAAPLIGQIDPIRLGEMQRATRVAFEYGQRLNAYGNNLKQGALGRLIGEYPAHGFVIDRKEATELFDNVSDLSAEEAAFCDAIWDIVEHQRDGFDPQFVDAPQPQPTPDENADENPHGPHTEEAANDGASAGPGLAPEAGTGSAEDPANTNGSGVRVRASRGRGRGEVGRPEA